jgi:predicted nucleic acid-binding protein
VNYFDTSYLVRLYLEDPGWIKVRELAASDHVACSLHGRAETVAAFHRQFREGTLGLPEMSELLRQFDRECDAAAFQWLPLSTRVIDRAIRVYAKMEKTVHLRAADALHLASAAENNFEKIYSNDARLLGSANYFGLIGVNIL